MAKKKRAVDAAKERPADAGKGAGRPAWEPSEKERGQIQAWTEAGYSETVIADRLEVDPKTLRKHCRQELDFGGMDLITGAVRQLGRMAVGAPAMIDEKTGAILRAEVVPQLGAICFLLKTKGKKLGWSERLELTGKDGEPLLPDLSGLTDEQLEVLAAAERLLDQLVASAPSTGGTAATKH